METTRCRRRAGGRDEGHTHQDQGAAWTGREEGGIPTDAHIRRTTLVKLCGIQTLEAAVEATQAGADFIGIIFAKSRCQVHLDRTAQIIEAVRALNTVPAYSASFSPSQIPVITQPGYNTLVLLDAKVAALPDDRQGGKGVRFDWSIAKQVEDSEREEGSSGARRTGSRIWGRLESYEEGWGGRSTGLGLSDGGAELGTGTDGWGAVARVNGYGCRMKIVMFTGVIRTRCSVGMNGTSGSSRRIPSALVT
ncbi:hypothetical protein BC938DRAFT_476724 [Jimgerdemannia flammicorona]|uniref:N-(5'-phosphoribosyl)anthranilate isomerase n=1 Tax=Jimgerdemannia flammicorona TaxID=994334 RepID=A0A433QQ59_9FUNG|nr:hypothetical protein BC938DRAFT_476724 [Jimgerdemannia flammicorona]